MREGVYQHELQSERGRRGQRTLVSNCHSIIIIIRLSHYHLLRFSTTTSDSPTALTRARMEVVDPVVVSQSSVQSHQPVSLSQATIHSQGCAVRAGMVVPFGCRIHR